MKNKNLYNMVEHRLHYKNEHLHTILIVDDEEINREILGAMLEDRYNLLFAADGQEALDILIEQEERISLVLLDLMMPKMNGFEVISSMKERPTLSRIPVIVLTSEKNAEAESIDLGAADFISKPYHAPEIILSRINRMIELSDDRLIIQSTERDSLTRLFSQNYFFKYCQMMENYHPERTMDAVVMNIDHFHLMNEIYGHAFGNELLKELGQILRHFSNKNEGIAGRGENDTFYMYLNHQENYDALEQALHEKLVGHFKSKHIHLRIGINTKNTSQPDINKLFDRAYLAGYTLRGKFNKTFAYYDDSLREKTHFDERLIHDIHDAIKDRQFVPYFQPKYSIQGDKPVLTGCEALIRWIHPELGMISPGAFITLFESNGLIHLIDKYIWDAAAHQAKTWKDTYGRTVPISINVSRIDFFDQDLEQYLSGLIDQYGLDYSDLHLEITESAYVENPQHIISVIERLRARGFIIEMDDFGIGYSSLSVLSSIPIDVLKIDMSFIRSMFKNEKNRRMIEIIMDIGKMLRVPVISEGVETTEQYNSLKEMGCDMIQGYYFSKPLPAAEFEDLMKKDAL